MGRWYYPPLEVEMRMTGIVEIETYILGLHNTIAQYIRTNLILELYLVAE